MQSLRTRLLAILVTLIFSQVNAQTVQWAHSGTSPGYEDGNAITVDDSGNVYVSGQIEYTTHFDGGQNLSTWGSHDIFTGKYAPDGTVKWLRSAGGRSGDVAYGVAVDGLHNCYATGEIEDTVQFSSTVSLTSAGGNDIFVSKYDINGQLIWAKRFGSTESDKGYSMIANSNGDIFVTGFYSAHIYFDNIHLTPAGLADVYTMKLNTNGVVQWAKKGAGTDNDRGKGITYDRNGNIYVAGFFTGQATFGGTTITNNGATGGFLVKYDPNGQLLWIKNNCCGTSEYDGIALDENGNIYTTGYFDGTVTIGNTTLTSSGSTDILIVKYDPSGNVLWAKKAGGPYEDMANGITVDSINKTFYITGQLDDHGYFDSHYAGAAGNRDVFIAAYDYNGNCQWVRPYGGVHRDIGNGIANDHHGYVFTTGIYTGNATFGNYSLAGDLLSDFYVKKVSPAPVPSPTTAATNLTVNLANCNDLILNFTPGNGSGRIIIAHEGSPVNQLPVDGTVYNANTIFGSGENLGSGNYVVYNGAGNSVTVTGLTGGGTYYFAVFEYNGTGGITNYLTINPAIASQTSGTYSVDIQAGSNSFCEGDTMTLTASGGGTYSWSPSSGLSATTGNLVYAFPLSSTTYTVTATNNGCQVQDEILIEVNPLPVVTFSLTNSVCENSGLFILSGGSPLGGIYSGNGVVAGSFDPAVSGPGSIPIHYSFTDGNGCSSSASSSITVNALPVVTFSLMNSICENGSPFVLTGGSPTGGIYSGNGVVAGSFDPAVSGPGSIPIHYSFTDGNGCSSSASSSITVNALPVVTFSLMNSICENGSPFVLTGGSPLGGSYSGSGVTSGLFDPSTSGAGLIQITYSYTDGNGCANAAAASIMVHAAPDITLGNDTTLCTYNSITLNPGNGFSAYLWSTGSTQSSITVDSSGTGIGNVNIFVVVEDSSGCSDSDTIQIAFSVCTGIKNANENAVLPIYPNPFSKTLHLQLDQSAEVYIYDQTGKLVENLQRLNGEIEIGENLSDGLYTLIVIQADLKTIIRAIKMAGF
ncbi:MAG TPA: SBBP repeat-containing protein [Bacteroidia bacterium]|nr:SBBP repeat-containing protein [Bacteroidia bacterium]